MQTYIPPLFSLLEFDDSSICAPDVTRDILWWQGRVDLPAREVTLSWWAAPRHVLVITGDATNNDVAMVREKLMLSIWSGNVFSRHLTRPANRKIWSLSKKFSKLDEIWTPMVVSGTPAPAYWSESTVVEGVRAGYAIWRNHYALVAIVGLHLAEIPLRLLGEERAKNYVKNPLAPM